MPEPDVLFQASEAGLLGIGTLLGSVIGALGTYYLRKGGTKQVGDPVATLIPTTHCDKIHENLNERLAVMKRENAEEHRHFATDLVALKEYRAGAIIGLSALTERVAELKEAQGQGFDRLSRQISSMRTGHVGMIAQTGRVPD